MVNRAPKLAAKTPQAPPVLPLGDGGTEQQDPNAPKLLAQVGEFKFYMAATPSAAPPLAVPFGTRAPELPFISMFPAMEHAKELFVPNSFWTAPKERGGRGIPKERADSAYSRDKIRGLFNDWVKKTSPKPPRSIVIRIRKTGEARTGGPTETYEEDGISLWMMHGE